MRILTGYGSEFWCYRAPILIVGQCHIGFEWLWKVPLPTNILWFIELPNKDERWLHKSLWSCIKKQCYLEIPGKSGNDLVSDTFKNIDIVNFALWKHLSG